MGLKINIKHYKEVVSTNDLARELALEGAEEGTVITADFQTKGRGRQGSAWSSPAGQGILLSIILRPNLPLEQSQLITLLASLAVVRAVENVYSIKPTIKWPNDIYVDTKKLGGLLTESGLHGDRLDYVIIGLGFNVNSDIEDLPQDSISIKEIIGQTTSVEDIRNEVLTQLDYYYNILNTSQTEQILEEYRKRSLLLNKQVKAVFKGKDIEGQAVDVNNKGALIVRLDTGLEIELHSSEVELIRSGKIS